MSGQKEFKCVVWDLDDTLWSGILLEHDQVALRPGVERVLRELDARGILHSIASKNDHAAAMARLTELGVAHYFLYPQISWNAKSAALATIQRELNIGMDAILFLDDQAFERDEAASVHPELTTLDAADPLGLLALPRLMPRFITDDSARRRQMYLEDARRRRDEDGYQGPSSEFLAGLGMRFRISPAGANDLERAEELTIRTNQLNSTGITYAYDELEALRHSPDHLLLMCELEDRYGSYGKIGLALVHKGAETWTLKLLLMSCRVMSRGVGGVLLDHVMLAARAAGKRLRADFRDTGKNKLMYVTYKFAGFRVIDQTADRVILEDDLSRTPALPDHLTVDIGSTETLTI
jgi:FkbH-like protein